MKHIYVIGAVSASSSYRGIQEIVDFLRAHNAGEIYNPLEKPIDHVRDWRDAERSEIDGWFRDLEEFIRDRADVLVADLRGSSVGRTLEQMLALKYRKPVIGYAPESINSPWPFVHTTVVVDSLEKILEELNRL